MNIWLGYWIDYRCHRCGVYVRSFRFELWCVNNWVDSWTNYGCHGCGVCVRSFRFR